MNKLRTLLVEDEGAALRRLEKLAQANEHLQIVGSAKSGVEAVQKIQSLLPELVLLDIELKDMNAFQVLEQVHEQFTGQLVFITAFDKYAVEAFTIEATDYLLKPYDKLRFDEAIKRVYNKRSKTDVGKLISLLGKAYKHADKLEIQEGARTHYFVPQEITWIEADGYYSTIHKTDSSTVILRKTLKDFQRLLPENFVRVNRSSIINVDFIERKTTYISKEFFHLTGGIKIRKSAKY